MIEEIFRIQKEKHKIIPYSERINNLTILHNWILGNRQKIKSAIFADFNKSEEETDLTEIYPVLAEIRHAKKKLRTWMNPQKAKRTLAYLTHTAKIIHEPKGTTLIISPWNYPFQLAIAPFVSALAAGNSVIIKPSEISENTSNLIQDMISEIFPSNLVEVIKGDKQVVTELLKLNFDHIFFTGSTQVGKIIAKAAAENLCSCTLELGGKSPVIVDETANLNQAAEKIVWGKFLNKGQTCIAPDYLLVQKSIREELCKKIIINIKKYYGSNIEENSSYPKIISESHHDRLVNLIEDAKSNGCEFLHGGNNKKISKFIEPTLVLANDIKCKLLQEEIFGPILPIIEFEELDKAISTINDKNPPLAIYMFSRDQKSIDELSDKTKSGGFCTNELVVQFSHSNLSFGGVKESGIGRSHGYEGFKAFSNQRSYLESSSLNFLKIIYPPFTNTKKKIINFLVTYL